MSNQSQPEPEQPAARVVSQVEIPQPPPTRPRRAAILVQTIGDFAVRDAVPDDGDVADEDEKARNVGDIRIHGGANGADDEPTGGR